jgi:hypothetical protein
MTTVLIIVVLAVGAFYAYQQGWLNGIIPGLSISGGGAGAPPGMVSVNKKIQFTWTAKYSGTAANAKTFYVYADDKSLQETLTTAASGVIASAHNYPSGTHLYVKYDDANNQVWYDFTVPYMSDAEAQAQTYNDVSFQYYAIGTYTTDSLVMNGLTVLDGEEVNATGNATSTAMFIYQLTDTGADNTGLMDSFDAVYGEAWQTWVTGKISGDNASLVLVNGADYVWQVGLDTFFADRVSSESLSKWKIGTSYVPGYTGTDSCSFSLDLSAFTTAADTATMQITAYACCDPVYAQSHAGNFGHNTITIAEQTVDIVGK